jgi:squalene-associated FAD-dependent desaturase
MSPDPGPQQQVVVVGGGWAGLTAAVELCAGGLPVVLIEAARQLGGRARSLRFGATAVDNGQHLVLGAYRSLLALLDRLEVDTSQAFLRMPLTLHAFSGRHSSLGLTTPRLPAPLHLLVALLLARGLSLSARLKALRFGSRLAKLHIDAQADISVQALLHNEGQPAKLISVLWEPLCIAILNTPIDQASARLFVVALQQALLSSRDASDLLIPRVELGNILPQPCARYLEDNAARVILGQRVTGLAISDNAVRAIEVQGQQLQASHVVLATPHLISRRMMSPHAALQPLCDRLALLGNEPVTTLYLQYPPEVRLPQPMVALHGTTTQWLFDHRIAGQPGLIAAVISARGLHCRMPRDQLTALVIAELAASFPGWPASQHSLLVREKRATFSSRVSADLLRPASRTPVAGLWLAGDYTDTGLPATLEGAVRSGITCADAILNPVTAQRDKLT